MAIVWDVPFSEHGNAGPPVSLVDMVFTYWVIRSAKALSSIKTVKMARAGNEPRHKR